MSCPSHWSPRRYALLVELLRSSPSPLPSSIVVGTRHRELVRLTGLLSMPNFLACSLSLYGCRVGELALDASLEVDAAGVPSLDAAGVVVREIASSRRT